MAFKGMKIHENNVQGLKIHSDEKNIIVSSSNALECLSNAVLNGGRTRSNLIVNHNVTLDFDHSTIDQTFNKIKTKFNLNKSMIGLLTAVNMEDMVLINEKVDGINYTLILTAGILNPAGPCDEELVKYKKENNSINDSKNIGTINIILIIDGILTEHALVNLFITITEAKTLILRKYDVLTKNGNPATGTSTDTIMVAYTGVGKTIEWAGYATEFGQSIGKSIIKALEIYLENKI